MSSAATRDAARTRSRRQPARWSDWARVAIPIVLLGGLVVAGWQLGYFDLTEPDALHEAARRYRGIPWLAPMFVCVYALLAALASPVSPLAYGAGAVFGGSSFFGSLFGMGLSPMRMLSKYPADRPVMHAVA